VEVCAKFVGDWSGGSLVKDGHVEVRRYKQSLCFIESRNYNERKLTITFYL